jgi:hypothetical protein
MVKLLKSFETVTFAPTCFGLHKPLSGDDELDKSEEKLTLKPANVENIVNS